jgi:hypothetical protein
VPAIVLGLTPSLLKGDELIAQVDECRRRVLAAKFEIEEPPIKGESLVDVADFKRNVIESDCAGLPRNSYVLPDVRSRCDCRAGQRPAFPGRTRRIRAAVKLAPGSAAAGAALTCTPG